MAALVVVAVVGDPIRLTVDAATQATFRDHLDVFANAMNGPTTVLFPLAVSLLTGLPLLERVRARHIANYRTRIPIRRRVAREVTTAAAVAAVVFFLHAFVAFAVSFIVWPLLGDPGIDPAGYGLTPHQAVADSFTRASYTALLEQGELAFGSLYALWVAVAAATYAALGACCLLVVPNGILALALPFLIYFASSVTAALAGAPRWGLRHSVFPFGLTAGGIGESAAPTLALVVATAALTAIVIARAPTNPRLS